MLPSMKLDLWERVFSQVQGVDYDEIFSLVVMLRVCWNYISSYCIIYEILQIGCQNIVSSTLYLRKGCMWYNQKVLSILKDANKYAKLQQSFYGLEQASRSRNICFDGVIKAFRFIQCLLETCIYKEVSGSTIEFLMSICCWHIVDRKWCRISGKHIGLFERCFSMENLD